MKTNGKVNMDETQSMKIQKIINLGRKQRKITNHAEKYKT